MRNYIFYTGEGYTMSPNNLQIENCQVLGWSQGENEQQAFNAFVKENKFLKKYKYKQIVCQEIMKDKIFNMSLEFIADLQK